MPSSKLSYSDTILAFSEESFMSALDDVCENLARSSVTLMQTFNAINTQLASSKVVKSATSMRPRWSDLQRDFTDVIRQHRVSAGLISGRLKMFNGLVLPLLSRNFDSESERSHTEKIHILKSYMNISADHAAFTYALAENALKVTSKLNTFHTEFAKLSTPGQGEVAGQMKLRDLTQKLSGLHEVVQQLCSSLGKNSQPDASILSFTLLRVIASAPRRPTRKTLTYEQVQLNGSEAIAISSLYKQLESAHNQLAHAEYSVQVIHRRTDVITTTRAAMSTLVSETILNVQAVLNLFLAIWASLRSECTMILDWLQSRKKQPPPCVETYLATGYTLYSSLAVALDCYIDALDSTIPDRR